MRFRNYRILFYFIKQSYTGKYALQSPQSMSDYRIGICYCVINCYLRPVHTTRVHTPWTRVVCTGLYCNLKSGTQRHWSVCNCCQYYACADGMECFMDHSECQSQPCAPKPNCRPCTFHCVSTHIFKKCYKIRDDIKCTTKACG